MTKIGCYIGLRPEFDWPQPDHAPEDPHVTLAYIPGISAVKLYLNYFHGRPERRIHMGRYPLPLEIRGAGWWGNTCSNNYTGESWINYTSFLHVEGVGKNNDFLHELQYNVVSQLFNAGYEYSERFSFIPHISVDRSDELSDLRVPTASAGFGLRAEVDTVWLCGHQYQGLATYESDGGNSVTKTGGQDYFVIGGVDRA